MRAQIALGFWLCGASAFACSGSHVQESIATNGVIAKSFAALLVLEGLACWFMLRKRGRGIGHPVIFGLLLLANPGIWSDGRSGDCGFVMLTGSFLCFLLGSILTLAQLISFAKRPVPINPPQEA